MQNQINCLIHNEPADYIKLDEDQCILQFCCIQCQVEQTSCIPLINTFQIQQYNDYLQTIRITIRNTHRLKSIMSQLCTSQIQNQKHFQNLTYIIEIKQNMLLNLLEKFKIEFKQESLLGKQKVIYNFTQLIKDIKQQLLREQSLYYISINESQITKLIQQFEVFDFETKQNSNINTSLVVLNFQFQTKYIELQLKLELKPENQITIDTVTYSFMDQIIFLAVKNQILLYKINCIQYLNQFPLQILQGHNQKITGLNFLENQYLLFSSSQDNTCVIWQKGSVGKWVGRVFSNQDQLLFTNQIIQKQNLLVTWYTKMKCLSFWEVLNFNKVDCTEQLHIYSGIKCASIYNQTQIILSTIGKTILIYDKQPKWKFSDFVKLSHQCIRIININLEEFMVQLQDKPDLLYFYIKQFNQYVMKYTITIQQMHSKQQLYPFICDENLQIIFCQSDNFLNIFKRNQKLQFCLDLSICYSSFFQNGKIYKRNVLPVWDHHNKYLILIGVCILN